MYGITGSTGLSEVEKLIDHRCDAAHIIPAIVWATTVSTTDGHRMDESMSILNATLKPFIA